MPDGKLVLTGLLDTSGYAADVQAKYQGFLITEVKLDIEGSKLAPDGFGFSDVGKFLVMDVGANDLFSVAGQIDDKLPRPVPLKIVEDRGAYRLYAGGARRHQFVFQGPGCQPAGNRHARCLAQLLKHWNMKRVDRFPMPAVCGLRSTGKTLSVRIRRANR